MTPTEFTAIIDRLKAIEAAIAADPEVQRVKILGEFMMHPLAFGIVVISGVICGIIGFAMFLAWAL